MKEGYSYLLQCPPGLANVLKKELIYVGALDRKQDLFIKRQRNHDLVFTNRLKSDTGLGRIRIAETVLKCPVFGRYKISKRQLGTMAESLRELGPRRLVVQVAGRQFDRRDLGRWIQKEMKERDYEFEAEIEDEVWMFCIDESYYFGIPMIKSRESEGRDDRQTERRGSLPPPIAAAMAFAGMPRNEDVILDPVCGSGTLLAEASAYASEAERFGFDIDPDAVRIARANLGSSVKVNQADSRKTKLVRNDVSLVLANLPFGVQFGDRASNPKLYEDLLREMLRIASPERWRAVLLTSDIESLRGALQAIGSLDVQDLFRVKIRGELATALLVKTRG